MKQTIAHRYISFYRNWRQRAYLVLRFLRRHLFRIYSRYGRRFSFGASRFPGPPSPVGAFESDQGVIYVCVGHNRYYDNARYQKTGSLGVNASYVGYAVRSAKSLKKHLPNIPITLFTDEQDPGEDCFDQVVLVGKKIPQKVWLMKIDSIIQSPYKKTLYIDADTIIKSDRVSEIFEVLSHYDMCGCLDPSGLQRRIEDVRHVDYGVPSSYPEMNGGVLGFHLHDRTYDFLRTWRRDYIRDNWRDQPALRYSLYHSKIRSITLSDAFNWRERESDLTFSGEPVVIHHNRHAYPDLSLYIPQSRIRPHKLSGKTKIYHLHIPKTGGTSLNSILEKIFGEDMTMPNAYWNQVKDIMKSNGSWKGFDSFPFDEMFSRFHLVQTHLNFTKYVPSDFAKICIIRHPIERVYSHYADWRRLTDRDIKNNPDIVKEQKMKARTYSLAELITDASGDLTRRHFHNGLCKAFLGETVKAHLLNDPSTYTQNRLFQEAKQVLEQYDYVAFTHSLSDDIAIICDCLGYHENIDTHVHLNRNPNKKDSYENLSSTDRSIILSSHQADMRLFEYARQHFSQVSGV